MKKRILAGLLTAALAFSLTACNGGSTPATSSGDTAADPSTTESTAGGSDSTASGDVIVIKFAHVLAPNHPYNLGAEKFKEILEASSPVPVEVQIFPSAQLGNERDLTEGMQLGTVDMALAPGTMVLFEPRMGVFDLPYLFDDEAHAHKVLDGPIGTELAETLPANGVRLLAYWENGFRNVTNSSRPIVTPSDLQGLKIRLPENPVYQAAFEEYGASVATIASSENYTALQQGVVDGQENPLVHILTSKFYEVQTYLSLTEHTYGPAHCLISEAKWQSYPAELQDAILAAAIEARDYERQLILDGKDDSLAQLSEYLEVNEIDRDAFVAASEPVWEKYRGEFGDLIDRIRAEA